MLKKQLEGKKKRFGFLSKHMFWVFNTVILSNFLEQETFKCT